MAKISSFILLLTIALTSVSNIFADQITLKNGDRLTGKIIKQDSDTIILQTDLAGLITVSKTNVEKILLETLAQDTKKEATPIEKSETQGKGGNDAITGDAKTVAATDKEGDASINPAAKNKALSFTEGWDGAANVGFSMTTGNTKNTTFTAGVRAEKSSDSDKWTTYMNSLWNRNRVGLVNVTTSNAVWGGVRYDRNITKKLFVFGSYDFERDQPQLVNFRSVVGSGLGYHAIKNDRTELDFFGGAAWNKTWYIGPNTSTAEALVGNTLKHKFNDRLKFQQGFTLYPNLTNGGDYRFLFDSTLSADITSRIGWFTTIANRYNSTPRFGAEKNDFLFATGLKVGFGKKK